MAVSISSLDDNSTVIEDLGITLIQEIPDSLNKISVCKLNEIITPLDVNSVASEYSNISFLPCYTDNNGLNLIPTGYIDVKLYSHDDYTILCDYALAYECEIVEQNQFMPLWYKLRLTNISGGDPLEIANILYESGMFAEAFPSFALDAEEISYDPNVSDQWGLYNLQFEDLDISVSKAWNYATGRGIKIAIVDQGIDLSHKDLASNIYPISYDAETNTLHSQLYGTHGTHCAGIAAAVRNNGIQIAGVAPNAKLMSISKNLTYSSDFENRLANGINWAWKNGADIISCSWRCYKNALLEEALDSALIRGRENKGCVVVKSAGNSYGDITYPGNHSGVIAVANMTIDGSLSPSSAYGSSLFVTAPGTNILSTIPSDKVAYSSGTSMAAPFVSGLAALILERNPSLTATQVREIIGKNAKKVGTLPYTKTKEYGYWNEHYGYGLIDAYKSVINTPRN